MATLVYKRTHTGDPDERGIFGCHGCMGRVRGYAFDSVIGIGATGSEVQSHKIQRKINWIGLEAHRVGWYKGGPLIAFNHFKRFDAKGEELVLDCPALAKRFYTHPAPRYILDDFRDKELVEIQTLLDMIKNAPQSKGRRSPKGRGGCPPKSGHGGC